MRISVPTIAVALLTGVGIVTFGSAAPQAPAFASVKSILDGKCVGCHGPNTVYGRLRLDGHANVLKGGISGKAVVPGDAGKSLLLRRVKGHVKPQMPPGDAKLSSAEVSRIESWIAGGARP
jgi:mono/diheme cytochrome c family protein